MKKHNKTLRSQHKVSVKNAQSLQVRQRKQVLKSMFLLTIKGLNNDK